jgi:hypothetical protein
MAKGEPTRWDQDMNAQCPKLADRGSRAVEKISPVYL